MRLMRAQGALRMALLEDAMHALEMTAAARTAGRKPLGYKPIRSLADVKKWVIEDALDSADGVKKEG